jgi:hypothetical protein
MRCGVEDWMSFHLTKCRDDALGSALRQAHQSVLLGSLPNESNEAFYAHALIRLAMHLNDACVLYLNHVKDAREQRGECYDDLKIESLHEIACEAVK